MAWRWRLIKAKVKTACLQKLRYGIALTASHKVCDAYQDVIASIDLHPHGLIIRARSNIEDGIIAIIRQANIITWFGENGVDRSIGLEANYLRAPESLEGKNGPTL